MAQRDGFPVFLRVHGWRDQSVAALSLPGSYPDLSVGRKTWLQPDYRYGGGGDQIYDGIESPTPEKPFFLYYVPGATHAPHHPTPEWIERMKGKFDMGWNEMREQIFANQKKFGVIPQDTQLTPWPDILPKWDTLNATQKKVYAHQAEIFAAYVAYTDNEIGRVIQAVEDLGKLDNTIIIYISGDNGTSAEGSALGTTFDLAAIQSIDMPIDLQAKFCDVLGSDKTTPTSPVPCPR